MIHQALKRGRAAQLPTRAWAVAVALLAVAQPWAVASVVHFWISPRDAGPEAPTIYAPPGATTELTVWARPAVSYNLAAFSLNLLATQNGVASFEEVHILNPVVDGLGALRHQVVFDSAAGLLADADGVRGFQGFSFFAGGGLPSGAGIGPLCGLDPDCSALSGAPSWRIATVSVHADNYGATNLFLEIGTQGLWQSPAAAIEPDDPTDAAAVFGAAGDVVHAWGPAATPDRRNAHAGAADAVLRVATGDFNQDGLVDGADLLVWQRGLGVGATLAQGDADNDHAVTPMDHDAWGYQFGMSPPLVGAAVATPEPGPAAATLALAARAHRVSRRPRRRPLS